MLSHNSIGHKITLFLGVFLTLSFTLIAYYYTDYQRRLIVEHNEHTIGRIAESVLQSLQTIMVAGYADIAQDFADNLKKVPGIVDLRILRVDGNEAFRDNKTIEAVNLREENQEFLPRKTEAVIPVLPHDDPALQRLLKEGEMLSYYEHVGTDDHVLTYLAPIHNADECHECHGDKDEIRGVLKLTVSMQSVLADIERVQLRSMLSTLIVIAFTLATTYLIVHLFIVKPVARMTSAMGEAARGDLTHQIEVQGKDELAAMGHSFNHMMGELREAYDKLQAEIRERKLAQTQMQESEERIKAIVDNVFSGILTIDQQGVIVTFNPSAEKIFGYSAEEMLGRNIDLLVDPAHRADHSRYVREYVNGERPPYVIGFTRRLHGVHKDGHLFPLELTVTEFKQADQSYFIGAINDITARLQAEQKLEETQRKMAQQEKMVAIGSLSAGLVHEVGNPIAAISGLIEKVRLDIEELDGDRTSLRDDLAMVVENIERLLLVIHDVSSFSSPNTTDMDLLDLNGLVSKTCRLMRYDARMHAIELALDLDSALPALRGNENNLIQVLLNLIQNSRDALEGVAKPRILVRTRRDGEGVLLEVIDNGCGMTADVRKQAFDTFFTTKPVHKGTGLGLAVCYSIINDHQGTIDIESAPGEGTTCRISLPGVA